MTPEIPRFYLKSGHVKPIWAGHPWIYAQAIARREGSAEAGDLIEIRDSEKKFLGRGFWSPKSAIPVRLISRDPEETIDDQALRSRIQEAAKLRATVLDLPNDQTNGFRLVHAEGDRLPGLIVDRYAEVLVVQLLTVGMFRRREALFDALIELDGIDAVVEIANRSAQHLENFQTTTGTVRGPEVATLDFQERGLNWQLPISLAQKTGFYFDQRENRARIAELSKGRRVLDLCTYLGGFALNAARAGASSVTLVDRSEALLDQAKVLAERNGLAEGLTFRTADIRRDLAPWAEKGEAWDLVILDPPKLSPKGQHRRRALDTYRNLNAAAMRLVSPGGLLVSCSCSAAISTDDLLRSLSAAAQRAHRQLRVLEIHHQAPDHPTPPAFSEGRYLDCVVLQLD